VDRAKFWIVANEDVTCRRSPRRRRAASCLDDEQQRIALSDDRPTDTSAPSGRMIAVRVVTGNEQFEPEQRY
jgi:hypothetical protein